MKRFSDFAPASTAITGDKLLTLQFKLDGVDKILFTGSSVLIEQTEKYSNELPFMTKIIKVNKFYTFS